MSKTNVILDAKELAIDKVAAASIDFCSLWPTAAPILEQLESVIKSKIVKGAIGIVLAAGNAYCGKSKNSDTKEDILMQLKLAGIDDLDDLADLIVIKSDVKSKSPMSFLCHSDVCLTHS